MRNVFLLILNTLRIVSRKKSSLIIYLILPIMGVIFSILIYNGIQNPVINAGIIDKDGSFLSAETVEIIKSLNGYNVSFIEESDINSMIPDRKLDAVIIIPEGYGQGIYEQQARKIEIVTIKGQETTAWIENYLNLHTRNLLDLSLASGGDKEAFDRLYEGYRSNRLKLTEIRLEDEFTNKRMTVQSMGFLIMFIMVGAGITSQFILAEKRARTYYRICSAPVRPREYIAANCLTSFVIVALQTIIIIMVMKYLFGIETFVPGPVMFLILISLGTSAIGINLVITSVSGSSYMASTLNTLVITPTCMLGGCYWPVEVMPEFMRKLSYFVPQRWTLEAIQKIQTGSNLEDILMNIVILLAFGCAMFLIAVYILARTENTQRFV